jgi:hypothetical protein
MEGDAMSKESRTRREFMGTEGRLEIHRGGYTYTPRGRDPHSITKRVEGDITQDHVKNFLDCVRSRKTPNSDAMGGHRSALASHLGKMAYVKKHRIRFDPADENGL